MSKFTKSLETATRKKIDNWLKGLGWNIDEESSNCNVFSERAKIEEQNVKLKGKKTRQRVGWVTSGPSKAKMISDGQTALRDNLLKICFKDIMDSFKDFYDKGGGKYEGATGNDHLCMATLIAYQMGLSVQVADKAQFWDGSGYDSGRDILSYEIEYDPSSEMDLFAC